METTFITIHDLSLDARILYASRSITDILGYRPEEVIGRSCWEYFHPDEIPFAQAVHGRGIQLDKAAVLNYCQIKSKTGLWVGCECVFTIVFDVLVGCTSIYRQGARSQRRAVDAPIIRQLFSSSPRDPRYHMLSYISSKFSQGPKPRTHEPRAALFLNRFTRTLTIMYATNALESLLGIKADELLGKSFYYCIQENCLPEAVRCLESAKANDSIAYLRFWYRDPRQGDLTDTDESMSDAPSSDPDDDDGGVQLDNVMDTDSSDQVGRSDSSATSYKKNTSRLGTSRFRSRGGSSDKPSLSPSPAADSSQSKTPDLVFDNPNMSTTESSSSSVLGIDKGSGTSRQPLPLSGSRFAAVNNENGAPINSDGREPKQIELEAVVSCTSDGLVVTLRAARPLLLDSLRPSTRLHEPVYRDGLFASPWAQDPIIPTDQPGLDTEMHDAPPASLATAPASGAPIGTTNALASVRAMEMRRQQQVPVSAGAFQTTPALVDSATNFMDSIREVAVFAWALTGINGSLAQFSRGTPRPGAQPFGGLPVWNGEAS